MGHGRPVCSLRKAGFSGVLYGGGLLDSDSQHRAQRLVGIGITSEFLQVLKHRFDTFIQPIANVARYPI